MTARIHVLLWTDSTAAYLDAIEAAGLADRVVVDNLGRFLDAKPLKEVVDRSAGY